MNGKNAGTAGPLLLVSVAAAKLGQRITCHHFEGFRSQSRSEDEIILITLFSGLTNYWIISP